jgi:hypothetical protein
MSITQISEEFIDSYNKIYAELKQKGQEKLKEVFRLFWEANPNVNVVCWSQYTPYYMDGGPCEFSVNDIMISNLNDVSQFKRLNWGEYDGDDESVWVADCWDAKSSYFDAAMANQLENFIHSSAMEKILESLFGDHCVVYATREGFYSESYEHD